MGTAFAKAATRRVFGEGSAVRLIPFPGRKRLDVEALYRDHSGMVLRRVRRFFHGEEAEEVVHEVFLKVLEKAHTFRQQSSPTTWLYQLTTNHCLNRLRNRDTRRRALALNAELPWLLPSKGGPDGETAMFLEQLWDGLEPSLREIGVYYFVDEMSHGEIAELLGVSRRTIGNRIEALRAHARKIAGGES